ncbi:hypothetical protein XI08_19830 [Bradyrhizobium sp. CCBAU 11361]|nr:hypothetical protein [Bradyrhizobium sp. CCBAU 11361]
MRLLCFHIVIASAAKQSRLSAPHPEERGTRVSKDEGPAGGLALRDARKGALLRVRIGLPILLRHSFATTMWQHATRLPDCNASATIEA